MGALKTIVRQGFLDLSWEQQKAFDFRKLFDPALEQVDLTANCINPGHQDDSASMVIYSNGVYCFGCKARWWPDQFLRSLGDRSLDYERGARKLPVPKFIPLGQVGTYRDWLWSTIGGHYNTRQGWLLDRGLTRETCYANFIGHTGEAFTIPIFGEGGGVQAIRYRRDDELASEDRPKYWGTAGANDAMLYIPKRSRPYFPGYSDKYGVILAEGELDALRLCQEGYPAASLTNGCGALKEEHLPQLRALVRSLGTNRITVAYDQDVEGRRASDRVVMLLTNGGFGLQNIRQMAWPVAMGKDVTELVQQYKTPEIIKFYLDKAWV